MNGDTYFDDLQATLDNRATSLDSWRTVEAKALPRKFSHRVIKILTIIEAGAPWLDSFLHLPQSFCRKNCKVTPLDGRLLTVQSIWQAIWTKNRYRDLSGWRQSWYLDEMSGAKKGGMIQDVYWHTQLALEYTQMMDQDLIALLLDRLKCFDRMLCSIVFGLQMRMGGPCTIIRARRDWYSRSLMYIKLRNAFSRPLDHKNGIYQGCTFSCDDTNLVMRVWLLRRKHVDNTSISRTLMDDSSSLIGSIALVKLALKEDAAFDKASGQHISPEKTVAIATKEHLLDELAEVKIYNRAIDIRDSARLVGGVVSTGAQPTCGLQDARVHDAVDLLQRIQWIPFSMGQRAEVVSMQAAAKATVGLEQLSPSAEAARSYMGALKKALIQPGNRAWVAFPLVLALLVKGHTA